ncbi:hypothetical protein FVE67_01325 [Thermosulfurimonas marina]|uniref:DUF2802 domain-containing protein n=1 Tax=Thermosulfurimonas marina TaxID=2047767 RepID=A0A6H1WQU6_9BACT|nr:hypothetical protein [Thermosulfurimonas marina]QJA05516.1 hypothetical protein FVE67_01325 [Thermosulfurimonas marina]
MLRFESGMEIYLWGQVFLDLLMLILIGLLFYRLRPVETSPRLAEKLSLLEGLIEDLSRYLEEEKKIFRRLERALAAGAEAWERSGEGRKDLRKEVVRLYREGVSPAEIARRLSLSEGEVELLISLERFKEGL